MNCKLGEGEGTALHVYEANWIGRRERRKDSSMYMVQGYRILHKRVM